MAKAPTPTDDPNALIRAAAQRLAQLDAIDRQTEQHQRNLTAWASQRAALAAEVEQITAAIKGGTAWPADAPAGE